MIITKRRDFRVAEIATVDNFAKTCHRLTPLLIFTYVGSQKAYYIFGHRVYAKRIH